MKSMNGLPHKVLKVELEQIIFTDKDGTEYDFDRYNVDVRSPMATHEYSVVVNHRTGTLSGDCVRYGSWDDLIEEEVMDILELVEAEGKIVRPYDGYVFQE